MVNVFTPATEEQEEMLHKYFSFGVSGSFKILFKKNTQEYSVYGADMSVNTFMSHMPVKFHEVSGNFYAVNLGLQSLQGCPKWVGSVFSASDNQFVDLQGGPVSVGDSFIVGYNKKIQSLDGFPTHVGGKFIIEYKPSLPLLRALVAQKGVRFLNQSSNSRKVEEIMNKYAGQGKAAALNCALDLKQAGFVDNARW